MIKNAIQTEGGDTVAVTTIDGRRVDSGHSRMAVWRVADVVNGRCVMTGITARANYGRVCVIRISVFKANRGMATDAIRAGCRMIARGAVGSGGGFANRGSAGVTAQAATGNVSMVETAIFF